MNESREVVGDHHDVARIKGLGRAKAVKGSPRAATGLQLVVHAGGCVGAGQRDSPYM